MRTPNIRSAVADLVFAALAFVVGLAGLPVPYIVVVVLSAMIAWLWTRRSSLERMSLRQRILNGFLAYAVIGFVLVIAFELGQFLGGHN